MLKKTILALIFLHFMSTAFSQHVLEGKLLDMDGVAIPFATVGIYEKGIGTITEQDGSFSLELTDSLVDDLITFSAIGYEQRSIALSQLSNQRTLAIQLKESITELEEVVVSASFSGIRKYQMKPKGNFTFNTGTMRLDNDKNGGAMALLIENDQAPMLIGKARLMIRHNSLEKFKVRLRFMSVDSTNGAPGYDLISKDLIYESDLRSGWLKVDLSKERIWLNQESFFLVFEWIMDAAIRNELQEQLLEHVSDSPDAVSESTMEWYGSQVNERMVKNFKKGVWFGTLIDQNLGKNHTCYYRLNSSDKWKVSAAILAAEATISELKN